MISRDERYKLYPDIFLTTLALACPSCPLNLSHRVQSLQVNSIGADINQQGLPTHSSGSDTRSSILSLLQISHCLTQHLLPPHILLIVHCISQKLYMKMVPIGPYHQTCAGACEFHIVKSSLLHKVLMLTPLEKDSSA